MSFFVKIFCCIISYHEVSTGTTVGVKLVSLNHSCHALQLYKELRNEEPPPETDPTTSDAKFRRRICREIWNSDFFHWSDLVPLDMRRVHRELRRLHSYAASRNLDKNTNPYQKMKFRVTISDYFEEYVLVCPFKDTSNRNHIISYYVSKEYNVCPIRGSHMPGRFIFGNLLPERPNSSYYMILAEEPAIVHSPPGFNVELYYLRRRKYVQLAEINRIDPLCKLVSVDPLNPRNQHYRFCVAVLRSSYFRDKISYPKRAPTFSCDALRVSFRTKEGIAEAAGATYYERMTLCDAEIEGSTSRERERFVRLYISRAYQSNEVFVYYGDPSNREIIYLENEYSLQELVRLASVGTGQGYVRCSCRQKCQTQKCKCVKNGRVCNSSCHPGTSCDNHK